MKKPAHHGTTAKHSSTKHAHHHKGKHPHSTQKHAPKQHAKGPPPAAAMNPLVKKAAKPRRLTPDGAVALCSARAVAESLRLALGVIASDDDVLDLYFRTASDPDEGASILATLHSAATFGLAGIPRPVFASLDMRGIGVKAIDFDAVNGVLGAPELLMSLEGAAEGHAGVGQRGDPGLSVGTHDLILGLALPEGDHAVAAAPEGWWSWGTLYPQSAFPGAVIEEAWAVRWAA